MAETATRTSLVERLGYHHDARLLIISADDAGMAHAVNRGVQQCFAAGLVTSTSVIVPGPWFPEFVRMKAENPAIECGVHLTVTSEWRAMRWGPVASRDRVPSLLDDEGYFRRDEHDFYKNARPDEVRLEFRTQIERAIAHGLAPTHLDSHMGTYHWNEEFFQIAAELAREFGLTMQVGFGAARDRLRQQGWALVDRLVWDSLELPVETHESFYRETIRQLPPGVTELLIFPACDDPELRAMAPHTFAQRVFDWRFFTDPATKAWLDGEGVKLIGYRVLQQLTQHL
jgi:predicted glycoside hydrolase/deacetylase ChbG (UPF0249 family)